MHDYSITLNLELENIPVRGDIRMLPCVVRFLYPSSIKKDWSGQDIGKPSLINVLLREFWNELRNSVLISVIDTLFDMMPKLIIN
ncbi:hypothetical protein CEXT_35801 [Caerostris extrusa]|uniref:Uncharacterized protein n=1 Tax=Caerostris extrusa TaxID=172846 RepID=A0AAV4SKY5_CAEEX|nr:hypothetical protein CEXT_35801 [Caerostris extrusa]